VSLSFGRALAGAVLAALAACVRPPGAVPSDAACDTVPRPLGAGERRAAIPRAKLAAAPGRGALLGVIAEQGTDRPLAGQVRLEAAAGGGAPATAPEPRTSATDDVGGFVLSGLPPGRYTLRATATGHRPGERLVEVRADAVDSARVELAYRACAAP
jgi:hypothetical protein